MTNISVPLNPKVEQQLNELVEITGANRVAVIRKAIERYREDEALKDIIIAQKELVEGKVIRGDLDTILKDLQT